MDATAEAIRHFRSMSEDVIRQMRARVLQCRRLARLTHDEQVAKQLKAMADEIEADVARLESDQRP
jgi:hypothetical protein